MSPIASESLAAAIDHKSEPDANGSNVTQHSDAAGTHHKMPSSGPSSNLAGSSQSVSSASGPSPNIQQQTSASQQRRTHTNRICRDYAQGICRRMFCRYPHVKSSDQVMFCHDFQNANCPRLNCKFLHVSIEDEEHYRKYGKFPMRTNPSDHYAPHANGLAPNALPSTHQPPPAQQQQPPPASLGHHQQPMPPAHPPPFAAFRNAPAGLNGYYDPAMAAGGHDYGGQPTSVAQQRQLQHHQHQQNQQIHQQNHHQQQQQLHHHHILQPPPNRPGADADVASTNGAPNAPPSLPTTQIYITSAPTAGNGAPNAGPNGPPPAKRFCCEASSSAAAAAAVAASVAAADAEVAAHSDVMAILRRFEEEHNMLRRRVETVEIKIAELRAANDYLMSQNTQLRLSSAAAQVAVQRGMAAATVTTVSQPQATLSQVINAVSIAPVQVQTQTPIVSMAGPQIIASTTCGTPLAISAQSTQGQQLALAAQQSLGTLSTSAHQPIGASQLQLGTSQITLTPALTAPAASMGLTIDTSQALAISNAAQPIISYPVMTHSILPH